MAAHRTSYSRARESLTLCLQKRPVES